MYGEMFARIPADEPSLRSTTLLGAGGELSGELAGAQNHAAIEAARFARAKDDGMAATGKGLLNIADHFADFDRQGAEGIRRLFTAPAPGSP